MRHKNEKHSIELFGESDFGDKRLDKRFTKICEEFKKKPLALVNHVITKYHQCKAAYRFWSNSQVTGNKILKAHHEALKDELEQYEEVLEIQDSTECDFTNHPKTEELGELGSTKSHRRGLECHTSLIVTTDGLNLGVGSIKLWGRTRLKHGKKDRRQIPLKDKESIKWLDAIQNFNTEKLKHLSRIVVADREADFYELYDFVHVLNQKVVVRLRWDRKTTEGKMFKESVQNTEIQGYTTVKVKARGGGENAREEKEIKLEVRYLKQTICPPKNIKKGDIKNHELTFTLVHAKEVDPEANEEPLEWYLMTSVEVNSLEGALKIIRWYSHRWLVEEFHKILKAGIGIEKARLQTKARLEKFIIFLAIISTRLLWMSRINRIDPEAPKELVLAEKEAKILELHAAKKMQKHLETTNDVIRYIAMLGGFLGRKSDGDPGLLTLWRGMMRFYDIMEGYETAVKTG
jgi:hypothetical protein